MTGSPNNGPDAKILDTRRSLPQNRALSCQRILNFDKNLHVPGAVGLSGAAEGLTMTRKEFMNGVAKGKEDVLQDKIWAYSDERRRKSKRQKDLADILRLIETYPRLNDLLPEPVKAAIV